MQHEAMKNERRQIFWGEAGTPVGSLGNQHDINTAVEGMLSGKIIAMQVGGVYGFIADAADDESLEAIDHIKGSSDHTKPFSSFTFYSEIYEHIDLDKVHESVRRHLADPELVSRTFGLVLHMRLPVKKESVELLPRRLLSEADGIPYIQNLDPTGLPIERFVRIARKMGVKKPAVTTLNTSGIEECATREQVEQFMVKNPDIFILLTDPSYRFKGSALHTAVRGSFLIVNMMDLSLIRKGFIPEEIIEHMLNVQLVNKDQALPAKYSVAEEYFNLLEELKAKSDAGQPYSNEQIRRMIHRIVRVGSLDQHHYPYRIRSMNPIYSGKPIPKRASLHP